MPFCLLISGSKVQSLRYPPLPPSKVACFERKGHSLGGGFFSPSDEKPRRTPSNPVTGGNVGGNSQFTRAPWAGFPGFPSRRGFPTAVEQSFCPPPARKVSHEEADGLAFCISAKALHAQSFSCGRRHPGRGNPRSADSLVQAVRGLVHRLSARTLRNSAYRMAHPTRRLVLAQLFPLSRKCRPAVRTTDFRSVNQGSNPCTCAISLAARPGAAQIPTGTNGEVLIPHRSGPDGFIRTVCFPFRGRACRSDNRSRKNLPIVAASSFSGTAPW